MIDKIVGYISGNWAFAAIAGIVRIDSRILRAFAMASALAYGINEVL